MFRLAGSREVKNEPSALAAQRFGVGGWRLVILTHYSTPPCPNRSFDVALVCFQHRDWDSEAGFGRLDPKNSTVKIEKIA